MDKQIREFIKNENILSKKEELRELEAILNANPDIKEIIKLHLSSRNQDQNEENIDFESDLIPQMKLKGKDSVKNKVEEESDKLHIISNLKDYVEGKLEKLKEKYHKLETLSLETKVTLIENVQISKESLRKDNKELASVTASLQKCLEEYSSVAKYPDANFDCKITISSINDYFKEEKNHSIIISKLLEAFKNDLAKMGTREEAVNRMKEELEDSYRMLIEADLEEIVILCNIQKYKEEKKYIEENFLKKNFFLLDPLQIQKLVGVKSKPEHLNDENTPIEKEIETFRDLLGSKYLKEMKEEMEFLCKDDELGLYEKFILGLIEEKQKRLELANQLVNLEFEETCNEAQILSDKTSEIINSTEALKATQDMFANLVSRIKDVNKIGFYEDFLRVAYTKARADNLIDGKSQGSIQDRFLLSDAKNFLSNLTNKRTHMSGMAMQEFSNERQRLEEWSKELAETCRNIRELEIREAFENKSGSEPDCQKFDSMINALSSANNEISSNYIKIKEQGSV